MLVPYEVLLSCKNVFIEQFQIKMKTAKLIPLEDLLASFDVFKDVTAREDIM